jgi:hypothetical protein
MFMMCGTYSCVLALPRLDKICVVGETHCIETTHIYCKNQAKVRRSKQTGHRRFRTIKSQKMRESRIAMVRRSKQTGHRRFRTIKSQKMRESRIAELQFIASLTVTFLDVAKFATLIPLSILISCKLSFSIVGSKISSLPILALESPNKMFM